MPAPRRRLQPIFCALALCLLGLWYAGSGIVGLARTAMFVHEAVVIEGVVDDLRRKPFDSWADTLGKGNLAWPGDVSYQPIVNFTMPSGLIIRGAALDAGIEEYPRGQAVGIIVPRDAPGKARLYRWRVLWGGDSLRLLAGLLLLLPGWYILKKRHRPARAPRPARQAEATRQPKSPRREQPHKPAAKVQEEPFTLSTEPPAPRRRRKAATTGGDSAPRPPRKPRSRKKAEDGATPRQRKPRRKAADQG